MSSGDVAGQAAGGGGHGRQSGSQLNLSQLQTHPCQKNKGMQAQLAEPVPVPEPAGDVEPGGQEAQRVGGAGKGTEKSKKV
jgi:hypothetical protein